MPPHVPDQKGFNKRFVAAEQLLHVILRRAQDFTVGNNGSISNNVAQPSTTNIAIPVGAGVFALVAVGALLFAKFGRRNHQQPESGGTEPTQAEKAPRGYIAEIEDNFKLPQDIIKSTAEAVNLVPNVNKIQLSPITAPPPALTPLDSIDIETVPLEYHQLQEYAPRKVVQAPRRKHSITLDIDTSAALSGTRPSTNARPMPGIADISSGDNLAVKSLMDLYPSSASYSANSLSKEEEQAQQDPEYASANSSMTSVSVSSQKVLRFKVVEPWVPQRFDELDLHVGEIVHVYQTYKDGWCEGCVEGADEEEGMFPRVCLAEFALSIGDLNKATGTTNSSNKNPSQISATSSEIVGEEEKRSSEIVSSQSPPEPTTTENSDQLEMMDMSRDESADLAEGFGTPKSRFVPDLEDEDEIDNEDTPRNSDFPTAKLH
ncbi:hypothetical protein HDU99_007980 [Rhizoclosmatium hyalinum]|nr:hypothetical protein HDU99_007980 [Rhizoclosmatium hyalinum]